MRAVVSRWLRRRPQVDEVRRAYAQWAPLYDVGPGSPIQRANDAALALCVPRAPERGVAVDAGCGTGRHEVLLRARGWERIFGFDLSIEMLRRAEGYSARAVADVRHLPCRPVELLLCSQVLGHVNDLERALESLSRLVRHRGHVVISELHPRAFEAGLRATYPLPGGRGHPLPHQPHAIEDVVAGLTRRGLEVELVTEPAPEPNLPREAPRPSVPLAYALRARRIVG